jgi:uncharacterized protein (DUF58 family)
MKSSFWWATLALLFLLAVLRRQGILAAFVITLALAAAASEVWARYCLSNVTYRRRLAHSRIAFGEETTLSLEFTNAKPLPLAWLLVRDKYPSKLSLVTSNPRQKALSQHGMLVSLLSLRWYERVTRTYKLRGEHRGRFQFGPAEISSGDIFGFQRRRREDAEMDTLTVYPKVVPLSALGLPATRPLGEWLAPRRVIEDPLRFAMVREYVAGDNPRFIHWKTSAHVNSLQTKVFDPSATLALIISVDVQTLPLAYECVPEYLEYVICAAASLAMHALNERHMVGLCANGLGRGGQTWLYLRPSRHPEQATQILSTLAELDSFRGLPFHEMLRQLRPQLLFGASVLAITAFPQEPLYEVLLTLKEAGHGVFLLTVGDTKPEVPEELASHHLGGLDAWQRLETLELA